MSAKNGFRNENTTHEATKNHINNSWETTKQIILHYSEINISFRNKNY